jgi:PIN domain nuclease of toxin-antitoxin system
MRLLLDTHTFYWLLCNPRKLSPNVAALLNAASTDAYVSAASGWEIATKYRLGRLPFDRGFLLDFEYRVRAAGLRPLAVTAMHAIHAGLIVFPHRDPFDRLIAAQAIAEGLTVATVDRAIAQLGASVAW